MEVRVLQRFLCPSPPSLSDMTQAERGRWCLAATGLPALGFDAIRATVRRENLRLYSSHIYPKTSIDSLISWCPVVNTDWWKSRASFTLWSQSNCWYMTIKNTYVTPGFIFSQCNFQDDNLKSQVRETWGGEKRTYCHLSLVKVLKHIVPHADVLFPPDSQNFTVLITGENNHHLWFTESSGNSLCSIQTLGEWCSSLWNIFLGFSSSVCRSLENVWVQNNKSVH